MYRILRRIFLLMPILSGGCLTVPNASGTNFDVDDIKAMSEHTKRSDVLEKFGEPPMTQVGPNGTEILLYSYAEEKGPGNQWRGKTRAVSFIFKDEQLFGYNLHVWEGIDAIGKQPKTVAWRANQRIETHSEAPRKELQKESESADPKDPVVSKDAVTNTSLQETEAVDSQKQRGADQRVSEELGNKLPEGLAPQEQVLSKVVISIFDKSEAAASADTMTIKYDRASLYTNAQELLDVFGNEAKKRLAAEGRLFILRKGDRVTILGTHRYGDLPGSKDLLPSSQQQHFYHVEVLSGSHGQRTWYLDATVVELMGSQ